MYPPDQTDELKLLCSGVAGCQEAGTQYFALTGLVLPPGCVPLSVDALLCPTARDGYESRLLFAERVQSRFSRNWNFNGRICERNWHGFSWQTREPNRMRLAQLVRVHLDGFRRA